MSRASRVQKRTARSVLSLGLLIVATSLSAQEDFSSELPRIPPTAPNDTLAKFSVAGGFRIELVASEPLLSSPVAIEWDGLGRMFVCEMRGYSEDRDEGISRITRLEDTDGDGTYDTSVVFADGLLWPTAIFPYDGGLFVGDAPNLFYFKDTDGDGKADKKQLALTGFGTSNVQGLMNSMRWGLDNRIHIACSSVGGNVRNADAPESAAINVRGRDIAMDPKTFEFTLTSGAAQHGMCFDDWGRKFVSSNSDHIQQVMYEDHYIARNPLLRAPPSRISIAADGPQAEVFRTSPVEPWRIVRTRLRVGGLVPGPIEGGGRAAGYFTGATGVTIYRGDAWPDSWKGVAIVGDVGSNLIHRKRLQHNGLEMIARRIDEASEFVSSSDIWFRPAQFACAPDGSLHVIDVCREVIEHPKSLPPDIKRHLDLTAGRDRGRIYRVVPDGFRHRPAPRLAEASTSELVSTLQHPNAWHRETAARLLYERQDASAVAPLRQLASNSSSPAGRLHAIYALAGMQELDAPVIENRLRDDHAQVRRHAIRLAERVSAGLANELTRLTQDDSIEVRYQLAFTAGAVEEPQRSTILGDLIQKDTHDRWMRAAVQSSLGDGAGALFERLARDQEFRSPAAAEFLTSLAMQIRQQDRESDVAKSIRAMPVLAESNPAFALTVIGPLLQSRSRRGSVMARLDQAGELKEIDSMVAGIVDTLKHIASDNSVDITGRTAAIDALAFTPYEQVGELLKDLLDHRNSDQIQSAAMKTLGRFNEPSVADHMIESWRRLSPRLRETATEVLFSRPDRIVRLFDAIDAGKLSVSDIATTRLQIATKLKNASIRSRATAYLKGSGTKQRRKVIDAYQSALQLEGDIDRGRSHFKKHCSGCHKVDGVGHEIGPSLASIKTRGAETILVNVLDPNREVNPQYLNYVVLTIDGRTMSGMISAENASSVTLTRAERASDTVLRVDVEQLQSTGLSIMPEGIEESIDPQGMADLIAFLLR